MNTGVPDGGGSALLNLLLTAESFVNDFSFDRLTTVSIMLDLFPCPCCHCLTRSEDLSGTFEICPVCGWEDDNVQFEKPDSPGGANTMSLNEARANYKEFGAKERGKLGSVRPPLDDEKPPGGMQ